MQQPGQKQPKPKLGAQAAESGEKKEDDMVTRVLTTQNPNAPKNAVSYAYQSGAFVREPGRGQTQFHVRIDGSYQFVDENSHQAIADTPEVEVLRNQFNFSTRGA